MVSAGSVWVLLMEVEGLSNSCLDAHIRRQLRQHLRHLDRRIGVVVQHKSQWGPLTRLLNRHFTLCTHIKAKSCAADAHHI